MEFYSDFFQNDHSILYLAPLKEDHLSTSDLISIFCAFISLIAIGLSIYTYNKQNKLSLRTFAQEGSEFLGEALLELDKIYINDPILWGIYDNLEKEEQTKGKLRALSLYYFNMFQMAYDFYQDVHFGKDERSKRLWKSWQNWLLSFLKSSKMARSVWRESRDSYESEFQKYIDKLVQEAEPTSTKAASL